MAEREVMPWTGSVRERAVNEWMQRNPDDVLTEYINDLRFAIDAARGQREPSREDGSPNAGSVALHGFDVSLTVANETPCPDATHPNPLLSVVMSRKEWDSLRDLAAQGAGAGAELFAARQALLREGIRSGGMETELKALRREVRAWRNTNDAGEAHDETPWLNARRDAMTIRAANEAAGWPKEGA